MLHHPVIIIGKNEDMDVVEITIVVVEEDEDEEKDFFPMIKEIIGTHTKMKVVGMIKSKHKRFATYTV